MKLIVFLIFLTIQCFANGGKIIDKLSTSNPLVANATWPSSSNWYDASENSVLGFSCYSSVAGTVMVKDGNDTMNICPANIIIGTYVIPFEARSKNGAWSIQCGVGASVVAIGRFS